MLAALDVVLGPRLGSQPVWVEGCGCIGYEYPQNPPPHQHCESSRVEVDVSNMRGYACWWSTHFL